MSDILSKFLGVILAFILLAGAPITIHTLSSDLTMKRGVMNEMTNFIDKVTDTGKIADVELADFYLASSSYGVAMDVEIKRYVRVINPDGAGGTYTTYTRSDNISSWNQGDIIQVTVKAIDWSSSQRITWQLLRITQPKFETTLAGMVR
ncbi:hypothetical protein [Vallitalea okinawensis]|uniref:hypothetical protein n=1 Tax=Vallitalea okinawensis TaxID=2078660 RepID=UPI000CFC37AB|nr:hypothetical protein [Vallitalea okinawensis]